MTRSFSTCHTHTACQVESLTEIDNLFVGGNKINGDVTLVDCGWSREVCAQPVRVLGRVMSTVLGIDVRPGDALVDQLRGVGIDRDRVKTIVATHLHLDHVGGAIDFPNAEVVCSDVELSGFRANATQGYRKQDLEHARLRPVYLGAGPS